VDFGSGVWKDLVAALSERLESLRLRNDNITLDLAQTALLRGEIAGIKYVLGLEKLDRKGPGISPP
jgi:hypothetical protein